MFVCLSCKDKKPERERGFVGNDWCIECREAELEQAAKERRLPKYVRRLGAGQPK